jgi:hypothetical protein
MMPTHCLVATVSFRYKFLFHTHELGSDGLSSLKKASCCATSSHNHYRALCVISRGCTFHGVRVTAPCKHYFGSKSTVRSAVGRVFIGEYYT